MSLLTPRERALEILRHDATLDAYLASLAIVADDPATSRVIRTSMAAAVRHVALGWAVAVEAGGAARYPPDTERWTPC